MDTQVELERATFLVVMTSKSFGNEFFPRDTIEEALATIKSLHETAAQESDEDERIIGFVVNPARNGVLDGLESGDTSCENCGGVVEYDYELCDDCQAEEDESEDERDDG